MQIGIHLKTHRENNHFTQKYVAEKLHITRQAISAWENNTSFPDLENLILLSQLYQISLDELIGNNVAIPSLSHETPPDSYSQTPLYDLKLLHSRTESILLILLSNIALHIPFLGLFLLIYIFKNIPSHSPFKAITIFICIVCIIYILTKYI